MIQVADERAGGLGFEFRYGWCIFLSHDDLQNHVIVAQGLSSGAVLTTHLDFNNYLYYYYQHIGEYNNQDT